MSKRTTLHGKEYRDSGKFIIIKYQNRKLYSPALRSYVTLLSLLALYDEHGKNFTVIEHETGQDITQTLLLHAVLKKAEENPELQAVCFRDLQLAMHLAGSGANAQG